MTECNGAGRVVSTAAHRRGIFLATPAYPRGTWLGACPVCGRAAPYALAEVRPDGHGYRVRYRPHMTPATPATPEQETDR